MRNVLARGLGRRDRADLALVRRTSSSAVGLEIVSLMKSRTRKSAAFVLGEIRLQCVSVGRSGQSARQSGRGAGASPCRLASTVLETSTFSSAVSERTLPQASMIEAGSK